MVNFNFILTKLLMVVIIIIIIIVVNVINNHLITIGSYS